MAENHLSRNISLNRDELRGGKSSLVKHFLEIEMNLVAEIHPCRNISSNRDELHGRKSSLIKHFPK